MKLLSSSHKVDFKNCQSPSVGDFNDIDVMPLSTYQQSRDAMSSALEGEPGQQLYNTEVYGSLRKGDVVKFFSVDCLGLVAATFSSTFSIECISGILRPMLSVHFGLTTAELAAAQRLTQMPLVLSFFFGLLSDCYPIMGLRRKGYMLAGLTLTVLSVFVIAGLDAYVDSLRADNSSDGLAAVIIAFTALASTGDAISYVCIHTRVVELSQREPLGLRGSIQASYLIFRCIVYIITDACVYAVKSAGDDSSAAYPTALVVFGVVIALPIPLIVKFWEEKCYSLSTPVKVRGQILWRIMQQKAVWSILLFMCFFTLFMGITFSGPSAVITMWAGANGDNEFLTQTIHYGVILLTIVAWRYYFMNRPWRQFYAAGPILLIVPQLIVTSCVSMDELRDRYFYHAMTVFTSISAAIGWLGSMTPLTEITHEGSEGAMVGLMLSLNVLVNIFDQTNSVGFFEGSTFYSTAAVAADTSKARMDVLGALLLNYGINALALIGLIFLPRQKLDTQQLRSYGGYTKGASAAIVTFAVVMFLYSLVIAAMTFIPGASCSRIAGGSGSATFSSTFAIECLNNVIQPMLAKNVGLSPAELAASQRLTIAPLLLSFFFGLLSDCYPIMGLRRKFYLVIGLMTTVVSIFFLAGLNAYMESLPAANSNSGLAGLIIASAALASTGNIITYVCIHTRVIELSQREPLGLRGSIQATYLIFRCIVYIITDACVYAVQNSVTAASTPYTTALVVFGIVIAMPLPLILKYWEEKRYSLSTPMKTRGQILWKIMQQKAVWSVLAFMYFFTLFLNIGFSGPSSVISMWAGASGDNQFVIQIMYYGTMMLTILAWRFYFMNRPWRHFYAAAPILLIVPQLFVSICISMDLVRDRYFYRVMTLFTSVSAGIGWLGSSIPLTEIIQEGSEGAMVGLTLSLYFLVTMFVQTNSVGLFEGSNFYSTAEVAADTSEARVNVLEALLLNYGINALAFFGLLFLPRQKLDTQQLRSYGGYTKCASTAIATFAAMMFLYSLTISVMTFIPDTSCIRIAGGAGC
ncbi:hypothetical protein BBJ29_002652 [Phytophthora kernoviae]|uniref:Transmembrane protein n=1 Tax=Phytophthora kernoviae TaxID=325452 RepID=A0A3F2RS34_9STRA|nr:hypothetical protein BBJ29_002652 [Phytophthora kernoviae]RLN63120.1 hypothetical protein BBP00_00004319 [Phytophthora kernoviae]